MKKIRVTIAEWNNLTQLLKGVVYYYHMTAKMVSVEAPKDKLEALGF